ncbi:MAG TPA: cytochrome c peroxidase, partial [Adhaeribacter sp.]|nr:cytochrome c peroxidase [Adhaeribacter sp.]
NTMSCGTCHQQKHAFTDGQAVIAGVDGINGTRSTMALINLAWDKNLMWDGKFKSLEDQVKGPIENPVEMHQTMARGVNKLQNTETYPKLFQRVFGSKIITEENIMKAIAQFERTLISGNSKYDQYLMGKYVFTPEEEAGRQLFFDPHLRPGTSRSANCFDCHGGFNLSRNTLANNGLDSEFKDPGLGGVTGKSTDMGKFKAPTLRNIELTAPYMHDGRFATLEDVLNHYNTGVKKDSPNLHIEMLFSNTGNPQHQLDLTQTEITQVIAFLKTLTDHEFVTNPAFSDPFQQTGPVK